MHVLVAHHGHCFDGAASAALFTRFAREKLDLNAQFTYRGLAYEPNAPSPAEKFLAHATNVILDYRYTASPLLDWYFDHHVSAFQEAGSRAHFDADTSGHKFHDGAMGSCTRFMADMLRERFNWEAPDLNELIEWAHIIDSASFPNAEIASGFSHPSLEITAVVQELGDDTFCAELIPRLATEPMSQIAKYPWIAERMAPIRARNDALVARMERVGEQRGNVAVFDLSEQPLDTVAKFAGYKLFPTAMYSVALSWTPRRVKLSVGFNPWVKKPRQHNIAKLCERFGGGGHPVVGAITLPASELQRGKEIVETLVHALNGPASL